MNKLIDRQGPNLNKKMLEVEDVERDESGEIVRLYVKEYRNDSEGLIEQGTPLNVEGLTDAVKQIIHLFLASPTEKVAFDKENLTIPSTMAMDTPLPKKGNADCTITWEVLSGTGIRIDENSAIITKGNEVQTAQLKATISYEQVKDTKIFTITIAEKTPAEKAREDCDNLTIPTIIIDDLTLPTRGDNGSIITWRALTSPNVTLVGNVLKVTRGQGESGAILNATVQYGTSIFIKRIEITILALPTTTYTPKSVSEHWIQEKGNLKTKEVSITSSDEQPLYIEVVNSNSDIMLINIVNNHTPTVKFTISETSALNGMNDTGSFSITFQVKVYLDNSYIELLGTIPCTIEYYFLSTTPED